MKNTFLKEFLVCIFLCSFFNLHAQNPISFPLEFKPQPYDILHYDAYIDLRQGMDKFVSGICEIKSIWTQNVTSSNFYFHLRELSIDSVFYNDSPIDYIFHEEDTMDYSYYIIPNLQGNFNDTFRVKIYYSGTMTNEVGSKPFGGVFLADSILFAIGVGMHNQYVSTTQHWLPCYDHPSDKATFHFQFITPKDFTIATNGITRLAGYTNDGYPIWESSSTFPIATYLMTFAMGKFNTMKLDEWDLPSNIESIVYYPPQDEEAVRFAFNHFAKYFYAMQNRYGRYPFEKIGYVIVPFSEGAMEHQTMITFPKSVVHDIYNSKDTNNIMALHEFSHQWFGNSVSPLDFRDAWFNESFATYSEAAFLELISGKDAYLKDLLQKKNYYLNYSTKYEGILPIYGFSRKPPSSNYPSTIYWKGAVVVGMLRYYLGDEKFFDLIRTYLDQFAYQSRSTFDFINFCNYYLTENINWFFDQWIFGKGYPILNINVIQHPLSDTLSSIEIKISQVQPKDYGLYIHLPIEFNFKLAENRSIDTVLEMNQIEQTFVLDSFPRILNLSVNQGKKVVSLFSANFFLSTEEDRQESTPQIEITPKEIIIKSSDRAQTLNYAIYDIFGNEIIRQTVMQSEEVVPLDIISLANGVYFITVDTKIGKIHKSFIFCR